ncbi:MAG: UDP-N-acetylmuramoyl-tripeptide--D-alanyl-D-alanine ligase [Opitutales bacterium]|nr:UDP-N-acetylmuramoyl-tripeptide--D-alanyl-D-alanine ligase [Opitutales bacterium]
MKILWDDLQKLVPAGTRLLNGDGRALGGFCIDTRTLQPGEIFVAIKTASRDGHDFVPAAVTAGAAAVLVEHEVAGVPADLPQIVVPAGKDSQWLLRQIAAAYRRTFLKHVPVIGVTGSVGKTSTKDMLAHLLAGTLKVFATPKNLNNTLGVPLNICRIEPGQHEIAVIEMGTNAPGEIAACAAVAQPDFAVVTNVLPVHLQGLGSMDGIADEKAAIAADPACRAVFYRRLLKYRAFQKIAARGNALVIDDTVPADHPARALQSPSAGQVENAVLALAVAKNFVKDPKILRERLATWQPSQKRGELRSRANGHKIFVDCYNASPFSMLDSVAAFHKAVGNDSTPRLHILGGMGELGSESQALHRLVGEKLPLDPKRDFLAVFGGDAPLIAEGAAKNAFPREHISIFDDIKELRTFAQNFDGHIMLKGSRAFALERACPED